MGLWEDLGGEFFTSSMFTRPDGADRPFPPKRLLVFLAAAVLAILAIVLLYVTMR